MLDNKGFAVTSVLYTLLIAFLLFLGVSLSMLSTSNSLISNMNRDLTDNLYVNAYLNIDNKNVKLTSKEGQIKITEEKINVSFETKDSNLIIYLPIYNLIGEKFLITIFLMLIAIIISQVITIYIINLKKDLKMENISILFILITYLIFIYFTYNPIKCKLFKDPIDKKYGIKIVSNLF